MFVAVHSPEEAYVSQASSAVQEIAGYMSEVNLDTSVYNYMRDAETSEDGSMSPEARKVLHHMRVSMEHEGIHLENAEKQACMQMLDNEQRLAFDIVERQERARNSISPDTEGAWLPVSSLGDFNLSQWRLKRRSGRGGEEVHVPRDTFLADSVLRTVSCADARRRVYEAQQTRDNVGEDGEPLESTCSMYVRGRKSSCHRYACVCKDICVHICIYMYTYT